MSKQLDAEFQAHVEAQENMLILQSVAAVRLELQGLKNTRAPHADQLECFKRLITLYGTLNTNVGTFDASKRAA